MDLIRQFANGVGYYALSVENLTVALAVCIEWCEQTFLCSNFWHIIILQKLSLVLHLRNLLKTKLVYTFIIVSIQARD